MSLFKNLGRIAAAPIKILDAVVVEPLAEIADAVADEVSDL